MDNIYYTNKMATFKTGKTYFFFNKENNECKEYKVIKRTKCFIKLEGIDKKKRIRTNIDGDEYAEYIGLNAKNNEDTKKIFTDFVNYMIKDGKTEKEIKELKYFKDEKHFSHFYWNFINFS